MSLISHDYHSRSLSLLKLFLLFLFYDVMEVKCSERDLLYLSRINLTLFLTQIAVDTASPLHYAFHNLFSVESIYLHLKV
jgi:hypothetical protein